MKKNKILLCILMLIALGSSILTVITALEVRKTYQNKKNVSDELYINKQKQRENINHRVKVKGIYLAKSILDKPLYLNKWIEVANKTEINSFIIDVKNDNGYLTFNTDITLAKKIGAEKHVIHNMKETMETFKKYNIYPIARIVAFKDPVLARTRSDWCLRKKDGTLWRDAKKMPWLNAYNKEVWNYLINIGKEAAKMGFKEVQFDYVRFPTGGNLKTIDYGVIGSQKSKTDNIAEFLSYARQELNAMGVFVSADVFGSIITSNVDAKIIGQDFLKLAKNVDYICPMIYPSHYNNGYKIGEVIVKYPDLQPYDVIYYSLLEAAQLYQTLPNTKLAVIRPWLQDFTATWVKPHQKYGAKQIREQIQAVYDVGMDEWIFWDASNTYTIEGFEAK